MFVKQTPIVLFLIFELKFQNIWEHFPWFVKRRRLYSLRKFSQSIIKSQIDLFYFIQHFETNSYSQFKQKIISPTFLPTPQASSGTTLLECNNQ